METGIQYKINEVIDHDTKKMQSRIQDPSPIFQKKRRCSILEDEIRFDRGSKIQVLNNLETKKHHVASQAHSK